MAWPDTVPVLEEQHIDRKCGDPEADAKDLITWMETVFTDAKEQNKAYFELCRSAKQLTSYSTATEACDDLTIPVSVLVEIWVLTMERLGYDMGK